MPRCRSVGQCEKSNVADFSFGFVFSLSRRRCSSYKTRSDRFLDLQSCQTAKYVSKPYNFLSVRGGPWSIFEKYSL